jgi:hypothetical protein
VRFGVFHESLSLPVSAILPSSSAFQSPNDDVSTTRQSLSWKRELVLVAVVYGAYSLVRNHVGSSTLSLQAQLRAFNNAVRVIDLERVTGIFHEITLQRWFIDTPVITFFNLYYGIAHFVVTVTVLVWLLVKKPANFRRWRSTLLLTTVLGLVGYSFFPLMPPRLINAGGVYGSAGLPTVTAEATDLTDVHFTDTLSTSPSPWSFDSTTMQHVSNQYAAMPSLHVAWAAWCALVIIACSTHKRLRWLALAHPIITALATFSTANHYFLDAVGGLIVLALGYIGALQLERLAARRQRRVAVATGAGEVSSIADA